MPTAGLLLAGTAPHEKAYGHSRTRPFAFTTHNATRISS